MICKELSQNLTKVRNSHLTSEVQNTLVKNPWPWPSGKIYTILSLNAIIHYSLKLGFQIWTTNES